MAIVGIIPGNVTSVTVKEEQYYNKQKTCVSTISIITLLVFWTDFIHTDQFHSGWKETPEQSSNSIFSDSTSHRTFLINSLNSLPPVLIHVGYLRYMALMLLARHVQFSESLVYEPSSFEV